MGRFWKTAGALTALALSASSPALAQSRSSPVQALQAANARLQAALVAADAGDREPPRLADVAAGQDIRAAFDTGVIQAADGESLAAMLAMCGPANESVQRYVLHGLSRTGIDPKGDPEAVAAALARLRSANIARFQDEIALGMRFSIACLAATLPAGARFGASLAPADFTPARREGLAKMHTGTTNLYLGVTSIVTNGELSPRNRKMLLDEAARTAAAVAPHITLNHRQAARLVAGRAAAVGPHQRSHEPHRLRRPLRDGRWRLATRRQSTGRGEIWLTGSA